MKKNINKLKADLESVRNKGEEWIKNYNATVNINNNSNGNNNMNNNNQNSADNNSLNDIYKKLDLLNKNVNALQN